MEVSPQPPKLEHNTNLEAQSSRWHVLFATWLGEMFDGMDASIFVLVLYPALSELLNTTSHSEVGVKGSIILATFMLGWAVGGMGFGILADYIGRARTLVYTILLYAIFTGFCALSHNWQEMAFYRFLVGCGIGGEISIGGVLMAECWRGKSRLHATGAMCSSFAFGYLAASFLNLLIGGFGWRWLFVVGVVPALLTAYVRKTLKEPVQYQLMAEYKKRLRAKAKDELSSEEAEVLAFTFPQLFNADNIRKTALVTALTSTMIVGYWAVVSWIPPWINQLVGTAAVKERSVVTIALNIGSIISALTAGSIVLKYGRQAAFRFCFIGALVSCLGTFLTTKTYSEALVIWVFFIGYFAVMAFTLAFIYVPELFATKLRATAFGFCIQSGRIAGAIAALIGGQLISAFNGSYANAAACVSLFYIVGIIATIFIKEPTEDLLHGESINKIEANIS